MAMKMERELDELPACLYNLHTSKHPGHSHSHSGCGNYCSLTEGKRLLEFQFQIGLGLEEGNDNEVGERDWEKEEEEEEEEEDEELRRLAEERKLKVNVIIEKNGIDVKKSDEFGDTLLHSAAKYGNTDTCEILLLLESSLLETDNPMKEKPLHYAARHGQGEVIELFAEYGANIEARNTRCRSPLHVACFSGKVNAVRALLKAHADVNARSRCGKTALHIAAEEGFEEIAKILLDNGADITNRTDEGFTPKILASRRNQKNLINILTAYEEENNQLSN